VLGEDRQTVEAVLAGEREEYRRLMEKYEKMVCVTIAGITGRRPEVEDLAQETFLQAYRSLKHFRGGCRFSTWLLRIAANKAIDFYRKHRGEYDRLRQDGGEWDNRAADVAPGPEPLLLAKEEKEKLYAHLRRLPPMYRRVLHGHYLRGFSYRELARRERVPVKTVESRMYRARKRLRLLWEEEHRYEA
jgi:RNA polymerase sigma factor (sigma-70 family)